MSYFYGYFDNTNPYKINYNLPKVEPTPYVLQQQINNLLNQILHLKQELYTKDKLISSLEEQLEQRQTNVEQMFEGLGEMFTELDKIFVQKSKNK